MEIVFAILALAVGGGVGYGANSYISKQKATDADKKAKKLLDDAKEESKKKILEAKEEAIKIADEAKKEERERRNKIDASEKRVADRETLLDNKLDQIDKINRFVEVPLDGLFCDLLWSDPLSDDVANNRDYIDNEERECSYLFGKKPAKKLLDNNNLMTIVRGH